MTFTDKDLKRIENGCKTLAPDILGFHPRISIFPEEMLALLARLEAAEKIVKIVEKNGDGSLWHECEAWRKACGE